MNKSKHAILFLVPLLVISLAVLWKSSRSKLQEEIHYHAGFIVYADGKLVDFSDVKYMHVEPCAAPGHEVEEDEQIEKAHLHDGVGDVVHVHRNGATWQDLFTNIKYELPEKIQGYVNGSPVENILNEPITPYDSVHIIVGDGKGADLKETISREHIVEVENKSETCGS